MEMTGKEIVCKTLEAEGIRYVFGNPGSTEIPLLDAFAAGSSIEYVLALHEGVAVAMADGYARASGRPGIVSVHACPGAANALGSLYNARADGVPVVVLAGQQDSRLMIREPFLSADTARLAEQFTKWSWEVSRIEELPIALRRAFKEATSPPTGPVFLALSKNVLDETTDVEIVPPTKYRVSTRVRGDLGDLRRAARLLADAERPILIVGPGVARSGAQAELVELAEMLAAPVYGDVSAFPTGHTLYFGTFERRQLAGILKSSDAVLVTGSDMFSEFNYSPTPLISGDIKAIHIDVNPWELAKNFPIDVGVMADPKSGLTDLLAELRGQRSEARSLAVQQRWADVRKAKDQVRSKLDEVERSWDETAGLQVGHLVKELRNVLDDDAIVVDQAIHSSAYLKKYREFNKPDTYYGERGGTLGWVLGAAIGVKMAQPQRQVVAFAGDGATMFGPQAIWTAAQRNVPVMMLVINNGGYMAVKALSMAYGAKWAMEGKFVGADIGGIDYVKLGESLGVAARRIERVEEIRPVLQWGLSLGKPTLIEVVTDPKDTGFGWPRTP